MTSKRMLRPACYSHMLGWLAANFGLTLAKRQRNSGEVSADTVVAARFAREQHLTTLLPHWRDIRLLPPLEHAAGPALASPGSMAPCLSTRTDRTTTRRPRLLTRMGKPKRYVV